MSFLNIKAIVDMGGSKSRGSPKWMVYNGKPYQNGWFRGIYFWKHPYFAWPKLEQCCKINAAKWNLNGHDIARVSWQERQCTYNCEHQYKYIYKYKHSISHRIHGTNGIFTYNKTLKINHSWIGKSTIPMDPSWVSKAVSKYFTTLLTNTFCALRLRLFLGWGHGYPQIDTFGSDRVYAVQTNQPGFDRWEVWWFDIKITWYTA